MIFSPQDIITLLDARRMKQPPMREALLDGFSRLLHFFLEQETDFLCGAPSHAHSDLRSNYRAGYYRRKISTPLGGISLRIPHLLYFYPRVSIAKRAKRLSPLILESLARIHATGVTQDEAIALRKALWTIELPDDQMAALTEKLVLHLGRWREKNGATPRVRGRRDTRVVV